MTKKEATAEILKLMHAFDDAMLVTRVPDGEALRARPMRIADCDEHGNLWFVTRIASGKVSEINMHPEVGITMQGGDRYLSLTGRAALVLDAARIRALWREPWRIWFPQGPDTPELALIHVSVRLGEYWDYSGVSEKLKFLFQAGKAYLTEEPIDEQMLANEKVILSGL